MPEKTARWGLLSTARTNERMIPAMRAYERSGLLAVCSRNQEKTDSSAQQWEIPHGNGFAPAPAGGRSLAQMILGRNPDIDLSYFQWPRRTDVVRRPAMDWVLR